MTDDPVARARALLASATPGPYGSRDRLVFLDDAAGGRLWYARIQGVGVKGAQYRPRLDATSELLAAAPTLLAELADEVEGLRKDVDVGLQTIAKYEEDACSRARKAEAEVERLRDGQRQFNREECDLNLLRKLANGEGGERTGRLKRAGYLDWTVTSAGLTALKECL